MKNSALLYGKVVSPVEFRSQVNDGSELYECLVEVQNKSVHSGTIKTLGRSLISVIYCIEPEKKSQIDNEWLRLKIGQFIKVEGSIVQDRVKKFGTSSVFVQSYEILDTLEETQGNVSVVITGTVFKNPPLLRKFENKSEKLTFLIDQTIEGASMKVYIVSWNNLANYINNLDLKVGDEVEIVGNLISREYEDKDSKEKLNLCELLAKRLTLLKL